MDLSRFEDFLEKEEIELSYREWDLVRSAHLSFSMTSNLWINTPDIQIYFSRMHSKHRRIYIRKPTIDLYFVATYKYAVTPVMDADKLRHLSSTPGLWGSIPGNLICPVRAILMRAALDIVDYDLEAMIDFPARDEWYLLWHTPPKWIGWTNDDTDTNSTDG